jgi:hypothetical protein
MSLVDVKRLMECSSSMRTSLIDRYRIVFRVIEIITERDTRYSSNNLLLTWCSSRRSSSKFHLLSSDSTATVSNGKALLLLGTGHRVGKAIAIKSTNGWPRISVREPRNGIVRPENALIARATLPAGGVR